MWWNGICSAWSGGAFGGWGWAGMALNLLVWAALIGGVIFLLRRAVSRSSGGPAVASYTGLHPAIRIAQERYARGEIDREQYLMLVEDLS